MRRFDEAAANIGGHHVQMFIPSVDRDGNPVPQGQEYWVDRALRIMGDLFGGATAFPPAKGVWRDDEREGELVADRTVVVFSYASEEDLLNGGEDSLLEFARELGRDANQGEIGLFLDRTYYGIQDFSVTTCGEEERRGEEQRQ